MVNAKQIEVIGYPMLLFIDEILQVISAYLFVIIFKKQMTW